MSIAAFLYEIEDKLKTGQATEHTYRSAVVGTRFGASAARPTAGNTALERQPLPILPTAFHGDPAKTSPPERPAPPWRTSRCVSSHNYLSRGDMLW
jgi:hypothetical protein